TRSKRDWSSDVCSSDLYAIWGTSGTNVFAVGYSGTILHYDGTGWTPQISETTSWLRGVWGAGGSDVFAVGFGGTILHYNGETWEIGRASCRERGKGAGG